MIQQLLKNLVLLVVACQQMYMMADLFRQYLQRPRQAIDDLVRSNMTIGVYVQTVGLMSKGLGDLNILRRLFVLDGFGMSCSPFALNPFHARSFGGSRWRGSIVGMGLSFEHSRRSYSRHGWDGHGGGLMSN